MNTILRTASTLALAAAALSAFAQTTDAFSNLGASPTQYQVGAPAANLSGFTQGFQFTTTAGGTLSGFQIAINNSTNSVSSLSYSLWLYADSGSDTLGTLLGSYSGSSTGTNYQTTTSALSFVTATGSSTNIRSGATYWLVATGSGTVWNRSFTSGRRYVQDGTPAYTNNALWGAFSVQVAAQPTPEPATMAALGLGAAAMLKRRKRG